MLDGSTAEETGCSPSTGQRTPLVLALNLSFPLINLDSILHNGASWQLLGLLGKCSWLQQCIKVFDSMTSGYRFSAFWLRSKCSICSYQLNIWYEGQVPSSILIWFLTGDTGSGACSNPITGRPGIAVPPGTAHFPTNTEIYHQQMAPPNSQLVPT